MKSVPTACRATTFSTAQVSVLAHKRVCVDFTYRAHLHNNLLERLLAASLACARAKEYGHFPVLSVKTSLQEAGFLGCEFVL